MAIRAIITKSRSRQHARRCGGSFNVLRALALNTHLNTEWITWRTAQVTVMLNCWEACAPVLSVTVSVNVNVPFVVGVPLMVVPPFDPLTSARPGGSCPAVIDQGQGCT